MAFNGIFPAPPITVAPCGLLSVARVVDHSDEEHWVRPGYAEFDSSPSVAVISNSTGQETPVSVPVAGRDISDVSPFWITLTVAKTAVDYVRELNDDPYKDQIKAATQKAVEFELWSGKATTSDVPPLDGLYLAKPGGADVVSTTGGTPEKALALIEQSIASSPTGARGIIHMTRDVASALGSRLRYFEKNEIDENTYAVTRLGTLVVIGSGYTGEGPTGTSGAAPTVTNKWIYATGGIEVHLGKSERVNVAIPSTNDFEVQITRPAAVFFDPSIFSAAQVTLP